ncbi:MAG TPA: uroporphyrinogen-III C-methyltransferase [Actinomycetota bacterium]|nr:uroporphyrinogen-III C-methyltransferase [Actinomycetota bacterium]
MSADYPLFLDVTGRRVVVVGGGPVATRRALALVDAGADVTVISPWVTEDLADARDRLTILLREFEPGDTAGAWLVHACTGDVPIDDAVVAEAEAARIWSVRAGDAARSPAWTAATAVTADGVQFAVNGNRDPGRAQRLRDTIADLAAEGRLPLRRTRTGPGKVYLVGGGPGEPDLLTVRARRLLSLADVVVTDRLAPVAVLRDLPDDVEVIDVGKAPGHHLMTQSEINDLLVEHARAGRVVVRLKGGDPFVLGRGGEEALECVRAGVDVEVVPGVTSAISVPAAAGIPVTHRGRSTSMLLLSAHDGADEVVRRAGCTPADTTLVLLMGMTHLAATARALIEAGRPADLPAAVISKGWTCEQRCVTGTLATIGEAAAGLPSPAVVVIGDVAGLHAELGGLGRISQDAGHGR